MSSQPGRCAGSADEYDVVVRRDVGVVMADGATLFADVYVPALDGGGVAARRSPPTAVRSRDRCIFPSRRIRDSHGASTTP